eukprot:SAG11_NODE_4596_length_1840_cov_1.198162_2_plen_92_part_00
MAALGAALGAGVGLGSAARLSLLADGFALAEAGRGALPPLLALLDAGYRDEVSLPYYHPLMPPSLRRPPPPLLLLLLSLPLTFWFLLFPII